MGRLSVFLGVLLVVAVLCGCAGETADTEIPAVDTQGAGEGAGEAAPREGETRFVGSVNSDVYHSPPCRSAKRIRPENVVGFSSAAIAEGRGYRACKVCRP